MYTKDLSRNVVELFSKNYPTMNEFFSHYKVKYLSIERQKWLLYSLIDSYGMQIGRMRLFVDKL